MDSITLKPNDRVCIGPSAIFLLKNQQKEADGVSMEDDPKDPITFGFANKEVVEIENKKEVDEFKQ